MLTTFQEIKEHVFKGMGVDTEQVSADVESTVESRINQIQDDIFFHKPWEWRKRKFFFTTRPPYSTGTVSITQGSRTVTGSGTTWTDSMKLGYLKINNISYKIDKIVSTTSLKLKGAFPQTTVSANAYEIVFPDYSLSPYISSILSLKIEHSEVSLKNENRILSTQGETGLPNECALISRLEENYYDTGSVTVTNASATVTGSGTSWGSDMEGRAFRVNEHSEPYIVRDVNSTTSITLDRAYKGETGSGKGYAIDPVGTLMITLRPTPDDYYYVEMDCLVVPMKLIDANDYSLVPNHAPLLAGAIYLGLIDFEDRNPVRIQQSRADYEKAMRQLEDSYKILTEVKWASEHEMAVRQRSGLSRENPLNW